ncbi:hypothetical protein [Clavibacter tessellarius]|uniref:hypothetical protein n=1 Tax=Clavibacter tessellarius TaxID=31965 RepID=UPI00324CA0D8
MDPLHGRVLAHARDPAPHRGHRVARDERGHGAADAPRLHPADPALPQRAARLPGVRRLHRLLRRVAGRGVRGEPRRRQRRRRGHVVERGHPLHRPPHAPRGPRPGLARFAEERAAGSASATGPDARDPYAVPGRA